MELPVACHIIFSLAFGFTGFAGNLLLFYLILQIDSSRFRAYSLLLLCHVAFQMTSSLANFMAITSVVKAGEVQIFVFHGPCIFQPDSCYRFHFIGFYSAGATNFIFFVSIFYRLHVVRHRAFSVKKMAFLLALIPLLIVLGAITLPPALEMSQIKEALETYRPEILLQPVQLYGTTANHPGNHAATFISIVIMFITMLLVTHAARWWILRRVGAIKHQTEATATFHKGFINALTCEGYLILFSFYSLIAFILITEKAVHNEFLESTVFLAHSIQFSLTPLFVIHFVNPLKRHVTSLLMRGNTMT